jgi:hypothetical protein
MSPYSWPELQIDHCGIKSNSKDLRVSQNNNLVPAVKFRQST